ncbi:MAG: hypothetical protein H0V00_14535 [Chloroflexia bacterium]|nr:hypothetical protein [Chloroflexia bacterium]
MSHDGRPHASRPALHRLLPAAGATAAVVAVLAHLGGGAALMHLGLGGALASLGVDVGSLGGGALALGLVALVAMKLLLAFAARRWWPRR